MIPLTWSEMATCLFIGSLSGAGICLIIEKFCDWLNKPAEFRVHKYYKIATKKTFLLIMKNGRPWDIGVFNNDDDARKWADREVKQYMEDKK